MYEFITEVGKEEKPVGKEYLQATVPTGSMFQESPFMRTRVTVPVEVGCQVILVPDPKVMAEWKSRVNGLAPWATGRAVVREVKAVRPVRASLLTENCMVRLTWRLL